MHRFESSSPKKVFSVFLHTKKQFRREKWHGKYFVIENHGDGQSYTLYCSQPAGALDQWELHFFRNNMLSMLIALRQTNRQTDILEVKDWGRVKKEKKGLKQTDREGEQRKEKRKRGRDKEKSSKAAVLKLGSATPCLGVREKVWLPMVFFVCNFFIYLLQYCIQNI